MLRELVAARIAAGMTQERVAAQMLTSKSAISRLERGVSRRPTLGTLESYARVVGAVIEIRVHRRSVRHP